MTPARPPPGSGPYSPPRAGTSSEPDDADLWRLEERFWTGGLDSARATTPPDAIMILPYPSGILQSDQIWAHLRGRTGWRSVMMTERSAPRHGALAVLAYRVSAEKAGTPIHEAFCVSAYLRDEGRWLRISHQQTPVT